jgi:Flp pilus assembly protein TadG
VTVSKLCCTSRRFADDRRGTSAVEFAMILPFMIALYVGSVEFGEGYAAQYKTTLAARTVADLASQYTTIDAPTMSGILGAASTVMTPFTTSNSVIVSEVVTDAKANATIHWSAALNTTARTVGQVVTLPAALQIPNISLIWGEVTFPYRPSIGDSMTGTINMYQGTYFFPRKSPCITYNSVC